MARNGSSYRWRKLRARVLDEESDCALCHQPVDKAVPNPLPLSPQVDHIKPVIKGGAMYDRANVQLTHRVCNRKKWKGDTTTTLAPVRTSRVW